jgi:hypothetical protein
MELKSKYYMLLIINFFVFIVFFNASYLTRLLMKPGNFIAKHHDEAFISLICLIVLVNSFYLVSKVKNKNIKWLFLICINIYYTFYILFYFLIFLP